MKIDTCYAFSQILPDMTSVIGKWQSLNRKEMMNGEEKDTKIEGTAAQTSDNNETPGNSIPSIFISYHYDLCKLSGMTWTYMFLSC